MSDLNRVVQLLRAGLDLEQIAAVTGGDTTTVADILKNGGSLPPSGGGGAGGATIQSVRKTNLVIPHSATPTSPTLLGSIAIGANHFFSAQLHTEVAATNGSTDNLGLAFGGLHTLSGFGLTPDPLPFSPFSLSGIGTPGGDDQGFNGMTTAASAYELWGWIEASGSPGTTDATMTTLIIVVADLGVDPGATP